jgi:urease accessory protein
MERDTKKMRGDKPYIMTNLKTQDGLERVIEFVTSQIA